MANLQILVVMAVCFLSVSCTWWDKDSSKGFSLPIGDATKGQEVYGLLRCESCHKMASSERPLESKMTPELSVPLGGEVTQIKTYGELVTSIINPSHKLARGYEEALTAEGKSKMKNYNDVMTISQLIDLVTFLQSKYKLKPYDPTGFPDFRYYK